MKESEVAELVVMLSAAFVRPPMTERTCRVYESMLLDLDREAAHKAVARLIATAKWLPTVAEIRAAAVEVEQGPRRLGTEAWGDVLSAIDTVGFKQKSAGAWTPANAPLVEPTFTDPLVADCVRTMGGWAAFTDPTSYDRDTFTKLYDGLAERGRRELVAGSSLALPGPQGAPVRQLGDVPGLANIGRGGRAAGGRQ